VELGMPIEQVADQLGHRDLRMLQKHYRHRLRPTFAGGRVLGDVLGEAPGR
jgi:integrase